MNALILKELRDNTIIFVSCHVVLRNNLFFLPTQLCLCETTHSVLFVFATRFFARTIQLFLCPEL